MITQRPFCRLLFAVALLVASVLMPTFSRKAIAETDACTGYPGIPGTDGQGHPQCQYSAGNWCYECVDTNPPEDPNGFLLCAVQNIYLLS